MDSTKQLSNFQVLPFSSRKRANGTPILKGNDERNERLSFLLSPKLIKSTKLTCIWKMQYLRNTFSPLKDSQSLSESKRHSTSLRVIEWRASQSSINKPVNQSSSKLSDQTTGQCVSQSRNAAFSTCKRIFVARKVGQSVTERRMTKNKRWLLLVMKHNNVETFPAAAARSTL